MSGELEGIIDSYERLPHPPRLAIIETYFVGFDISENDEAVMTIATHGGKGLRHIKTIQGKAAKELYEMLTNKSLERGV